MDPIQREIEEQRYHDIIGSGSFQGMFGDSKLLQGPQPKVFENVGKEVFCSYEYEGKPVRISVMTCLNDLWALMAVKALNRKFDQDMR